MKLSEFRVVKVTKHRIFSLAVHPSTDTTLAVAGDKWGKIGFWNFVRPLSKEFHTRTAVTVTCSVLHVCKFRHYF